MYRMLIVDDEISIVEWLKTLLSETFGEILDIRCESSSQNALNLIYKSNIDIALYDISLPNIDGLTLAEKTREFNPTVQIIFLTGYSFFNYARNAVKLGAVDYILKNEDDDVLIGAVNKAIERKNEQLRNEGLEQFTEQQFSKRDEKTEFLIALENKNLQKAIEIVENSLQDLSQSGAKSGSSEKAMELCLDILSFSNRVGLYNDFLARLDLLTLLHSQVSDLTRIKQVIKKALEMLFTLMGGGNVKPTVSVIEFARQYIHENIHKDLSLVSVAETVYMNPSYFSYLYKTETGQNVSDYIRETRVVEAMRLLRESDLAIQEIAERVGYHNPAYFTRFFKQRTGYSPQAYREMNRKPGL